MASIENYIPVTTGTKKRSTLGKIADGAVNYYTGMADAGLGILGMGDIINEKSYRGDNADKWDKGTGVVSKVGQVAGSVALTMATGGAAAPSLGVALGGALLPKSFESGGMRNIVSEDNELIELQGNTHAQGGINIGNGDEAEGGETIFNSRNSGQFVFSEKLKLPNSKKSFADESKKIEKEYKNNKDSLREKAMKKRIGNLAALQESLKPKEKILGNKFELGGERGRLEKNPIAVNTINKYGMDIKLDPVSSQVIGNLFNESAVLHKQYNANIDYEDPLANLSMNLQTYSPEVSIIGKKANQFDIKKGKLSIPPLNQQLRLRPDKLSIQNDNIKTSLPIKADSSKSVFNLAEVLNFSPKINKRSTTLHLNENKGLIKGNKLGENIGKQTVDFSKVKATSPEDEKVSTKLKNISALPQIIGYGAQALANLPGLFTKPERVKYDRVAPDLVNLSAEREALTQDRNLSRAISRKTAAGSNNVGQALNFLGASESDLSRQFGQNISKSFQTEANLNSEIKNKAAMFNAEISRAEQDANAAERDAAKGTRLQSLSNIGSIAALGVKDWMDTKYKLAQLGALDTGDFVYVYDRWNNPVKKEKKYNADGTWDGKSFKN